MTDLNFDKLFKMPESTGANSKKEFEVIPTGVYDAKVSQAQVDLTGPTPKVTIRYKITSGEYENRVLFANYNLNETGSSFLMKDLSLLGVTERPKSMDHLSKLLLTVTDKTAEVYAKQRAYTKKDGSTGYGHNVYVNAPMAKNSSAPQVDTDEDFSFV